MRAAFEELGIAPTADRASIRRAYAVRLKRTRPEDDAAAFARLRKAYEKALAGSDRAICGPISRQLGEDTSPVVTAPAAEPRPESGSIEPTPERHPPSPERSAQTNPAPEKPVPAKQAPNPRTRAPLASRALVPSEAALLVAAALNRGDAAAASSALMAGREGSTLSLAEGMALEDRLLSLLVSDLTVPGPTVVAVAQELGWFGRPQLSRYCPLIDRLHARSEAELWLAALQKTARSWRFYMAGRRAAASRLLVGRGFTVLSRLLPPEPPLRRVLAEYHLHQAWVVDRFDADRLAFVERMAGRGFTRWAGMIWLAVAFLPIALAGTAGGSFVAFPLFGLAAFLLRRWARPILFWMFGSAAVVLIGTLLEH